MKTKHLAFILCAFCVIFQSPMCKAQSSQGYIITLLSTNVVHPKNINIIAASTHFHNSLKIISGKDSLYFAILNMNIGAIGLAGCCENNYLDLANDSLRNNGFLIKKYEDIMSYNCTSTGYCNVEFDKEKPSFYIRINGIKYLSAFYEYKAEVCPCTTPIAYDNSGVSEKGIGINKLMFNFIAVKKIEKYKIHNIEDVKYKSLKKTLKKNLKSIKNNSII